MLSSSELRRKLKRFKSFMADLAIQQNLLKGHTDYTKFIILCRSRTGSNLLLNLLQSHPEIRLFYELFSPEDSETTFWDFPTHNRQDVLEMSRNQPLDFLDRLVFREMPQFTSAVGFKIFYYHARQGRMISVWDWLKENQEIKVIHLTRKNILKTYVSREIALNTNAWVSKGKQKTGTIPPITIDSDRLREAFQKTRQWEQESEAFFSQHSMINITYEDLSKNYLEETKKIQEFLNVKYQPLYISNKKQSTGNIKEKISNYSELKQKFQHTSWQGFFE